MKRKAIYKMLGIVIAATALTAGITVGKAKTKKIKEKEGAEADQTAGIEQINTAVDHIVDRTLIGARKALDEAAAPVQIKLGHERERAENEGESVMTLEFKDADNTKIEVPYPKHELIDNIGKMGRVAQHLSNIFEKEFEYID